MELTKIQTANHTKLTNNTLSVIKTIEITENYTAIELIKKRNDYQNKVDYWTNKLTEIEDLLSQYDKPIEQVIKKL